MPIRTGSVVAVMVLLGGAAGSAENTSGALGSTWADASKMPDLFSGMWMSISSFVESEEKRNVPFTAKAQQYADAFKFKRDIPYAQDGCATPGLPIAMRTGPIKFTYAPGLISIYMQAIGHTRFIRMNQPMGKTSPKYYGNSVGHWEGDTLVVETADFLPEISFQYGVGKGLPPEESFGPNGPGGRAGGPLPGAPPDGTARGGGPGDPDLSSPIEGLSKAIWGPHGEDMRMVERMRVVDANTLEFNLTVYDDTVWTKPYVTRTRNYMRRPTGEPDEWVCTVSITSFDPESNTYVDKDPEEMVKYLDKLGR